MSKSFIIGSNGCNLTVENRRSSTIIDNNFLNVEIFSDGRILVRDKFSDKRTFSQSQISYKETIDKFIDTNKYGLCISSCDKFANLAERYLKIGVFA